MKNKNILKILGLFIITMIIYLLITTLIASFNLIDYQTVSIVSFIFIIMLFMISGILIGKKSIRKGYLNGLLIGLLEIFLLLILSFLFHNSFDIKILLYYLELLISSVFGSMIGINFKK